MQPTNPNVHTYVNGTDVKTHRYAIIRTLFCNSLFEQSCTYFPCYQSAVWSVKWGVWSVKCGVRSVEFVNCRVWSVECGVRSVKCGVWSEAIIPLFSRAVFRNITTGLSPAFGSAAQGSPLPPLSLALPVQDVQDTLQELGGCNDCHEIYRYMLYIYIYVYVYSEIWFHLIWLIDLLTYWSIYRFIDWFIDWLAESVTD